MKKQYIAIDQYGQVWKNLEHPRKDLMEKIGCNHAEKMYVDGEKMIELVDLRIGATASTAYACVWFKSFNKWAYGSGKAGGYGYDKGSAAAEAAFRAAGMVTSGFGGTGCNREAVKAAGEYLSNGKPVFVVEFYG